MDESTSGKGGLGGGGRHSDGNNMLDPQTKTCGTLLKKNRNERKSAVGKLNIPEVFRGKSGNGIPDMFQLSIINLPSANTTSTASSSNTDVGPSSSQRLVTGILDGSDPQQESVVQAHVESDVTPSDAVDDRVANYRNSDEQRNIQSEQSVKSISTSSLTQSTSPPSFCSDNSFESSPTVHDKSLSPDRRKGCMHVVKTTVADSTGIGIAIDIGRNDDKVDGENGGLLSSSGTDRWAPISSVRVDNPTCARRDRTTDEKTTDSDDQYYSDHACVSDSEESVSLNDMEVTRSSSIVTSSTMELDGSISSLKDVLPEVLSQPVPEGNEDEEDGEEDEQSRVELQRPLSTKPKGIPRSPRKGRVSPPKPRISLDDSSRLECVLHYSLPPAGSSSFKKAKPGNDRNRVQHAGFGGTVSSSGSRSRTLSFDRSQAEPPLSKPNPVNQCVRSGGGAALKKTDDPKFQKECVGDKPPVIPRRRSTEDPAPPQNRGNPVATASPAPKQKPLMDLRAILKKNERKVEQRKPVGGKQSEFNHYYGSLPAIPFMKSTKREESAKKRMSEPIPSKKVENRTSSDDFSKPGGTGLTIQSPILSDNAMGESKQGSSKENKATAITIFKDFDEAQLRLWKIMATLDHSEDLMRRPQEVPPLVPIQKSRGDALKITAQPPRPHDDIPQGVVGGARGESSIRSDKATTTELSGQSMGVPSIAKDVTCSPPPRGGGKFSIRSPSSSPFVTSPLSPPEAKRLHQLKAPKDSLVKLLLTPTLDEESNESRNDSDHRKNEKRTSLHPRGELHAAPGWELSGKSVYQNIDSFDEDEHGTGATVKVGEALSPGSPNSRQRQEQKHRRLGLVKSKVDMFAAHNASVVSKNILDGSTK